VAAFLQERPTPSSARAMSTCSSTSSLIYFFCYFWTAITFNPKDMAENLKD
jgi:preprotein translocase subunit SecY